MGMGYRPIEFEAKGLRMADRRSRMEHGLAVLAASVAGGGPPLWVGVTSVVAARRAGRHGLGLFISGAFSKSVVDEFIAAHRQAWADAGAPGAEPPLLGLLRNLWVVDGEAERRRAMNWVRSSYLVYAGLAPDAFSPATITVVGHGIRSGPARWPDPCELRMEVLGLDVPVWTGTVRVSVPMTATSELIRLGMDSMPTRSSSTSRSASKRATSIPVVYRKPCS